MKKTKSSIRTRLIAVIFIVVAAVIVFCWLMNTLFLEKLYIRAKEGAILEAFIKLDKAAEDGSLYTDDYESELEAWVVTDNISLLVISSDGQLILSNLGSSNMMIDQLYRTMFFDNDKGEILQSAANYSIERRADNRMGQEYLLLWGSLSDGNTVLLRAAIESMRDSARMANMLLFAAGAAALLIGLMAAVAVSGYYTRPLRRLSAIAEQMTELDFEAKYVPRNRADEIDALGLSMNELSDRLEGTIRELKNANLELQRDIRLRDENDSMRADFISNVSHELKTPLALIGGYAEGLKEAVNDDPEERDYYCDVIIDETDRMNRMVRQLLDLNRLEYGRDSVQMERFDVTELIKGVVSGLEPMASEKSLVINKKLPERCDVWTDETLAEMVVTNYLTNAIHYCRSEGMIEIGLLKTENGIRLYVYNEGNPIPEESIDRLWEKFYKVDKARSREYGGSGIGLSIVKAAADTLGTACGAENKEDGVSFWFDFAGV